MSDLTDEELELATTVGDRLQKANRRAYVDRDTLNLADRLQRAALELQRHRSALAADRERVRSVAREAAREELDDCDGELVDSTVLSERIATRVADQLATARPVLSEEERLSLESLLEYLSQQRAASAFEGRSGDSDAYLCWHAALSKLLGSP